VLLSPESSKFFYGFFKSRVIFLDSSRWQGIQELTNTDELRIGLLKYLEEDVFDRFIDADGINAKEKKRLGSPLIWCLFH
jgi:hypothetical protein